MKEMNYYMVKMYGLVRGGFVDVFKNDEEIISVDFKSLKEGHALAKKLAQEYNVETYTYEREYSV